MRLQETREATNIVDQLLDAIPSGPIMAKVPRIIKVPAGEAYVATENPLGEMGYYVVSKGDLEPFRVKIRTPSFSNISIVPWVMQAAPTCPTSSPFWVRCTSSSGTSTDEWGPVSELTLSGALELAYWAETSIKLGVALIVIPTPALMLGYLFLLKMMAFMQSRLGPMEAGPHGSLQLHGRRSEVPPEGGHPSRRCRPAGVRGRPR